MASKASRLSRKTFASSAIVLGLYWYSGGFQNRYLIVDGPDYVVVGKSEFEAYVRDHACLSHDEKKYPRERVIVHRCYI